MTQAGYPVVAVLAFWHGGARAGRRPGRRLLLAETGQWRGRRGGTAIFAHV